jgi:hypothetical protein
MLRRDRGTETRGGGVIVYIKKTIPIMDVVFDENYEIITLSFFPNKKTQMSLIACYRPPNSNNENDFLKRLDELTLKVEDKVEETIIIGDLNFDILNNNKNKLNEFIADRGLSKTSSLGTRYNPVTKYFSQLDVILCYFLISLTSSISIDCPFSDHRYISSSFNFNKCYNKPDKRLSRCLNSEKLEKIKHSLNSVLSTLTFESNDVNFAWSLIKNIITSCIDATARKKQMPPKKSNNCPWLNKSYINLTQKRDIAFKKAIHNKENKDLNLFHWTNFKSLRNSCHKLFYRNKSLYFKNFITTTSVCAKKLWKKLSPYLTPNRKTLLIASVILPGPIPKTDIDLAFFFCNYFATIAIDFTITAICITYLHNHLSSQTYFKRPLDRNKGFRITAFSLKEVVDGLKSLPSNSGEGEVGIESIIFAKCADELGPHITNIFNLIVRTSNFPTEWKCAHITPVYKGKGPKSVPGNYRPISILAPISKLLETLISTQLTAHLESNNMLHPAQFGFRKKLSCEIALTSLIEDWRYNLDSGNDIIAVFLDLSKAFDKVDHELLLTKLSYYNLDQSLLTLIKSYLENRSIKVNINGTLSHSQPIHIGVPQGSVLGPLLFIIFINDMCFLNLNSKICLYADDTTISYHGRIPASIIASLEHDLILIMEWLKHNKLVINVDKSQAMHFCSNLKTKKTTQKTNKQLKIKCNGDNISMSSEVKLLGVIIDNKLSFASQITNICKKVNSKTFLLNKSLYLFTENFKPILFKLFIQSHFDYCSTVIMYQSNQSYKNRLITCFNRSIKRLLKINLSGLALSEQHDKLKKVNILPLLYRHFFRFCTFLFNTLKNNNTFVSTSLNNNLSSSSTRNQYSELSFKKIFKQFSFISISIKLLNFFLYIEFSKENSSISKFKKFLYSDIVYLYDRSLRFWT